MKKEILDSYEILFIYQDGEFYKECKEVVKVLGKDSHDEAELKWLKESSKNYKNFSIKSITYQ